MLYSQTRKHVVSLQQRHIVSLPQRRKILNESVREQKIPGHAAHHCAQNFGTVLMVIAILAGDPVKVVFLTKNILWCLYMCLYASVMLPYTSVCIRMRLYAFVCIPKPTKYVLK